ncbi:MAG TPA: hypothetical protein ENK91_13030 [Bacteroidetes bacterium]|jgi:hypothetical protein|nr:hypothetical protein [Bacteroidota bacterium]
MKIISILFISLVISGSAFSQIVDKPYNVGLGLGIVHPNLVLNKGSSDTVSIKNSTGFIVVLNGEYFINKSISLSPKIGLAFNRGTVIFEKSNGYKENYDLMSVSYDFMLDLTINKSNNALKPYILFGGKYKIPMTGKMNTSKYPPENSSFAIDVGIGLNKSITKLIVNPEIRYSYGISNINSHPKINSLYFHSISFIVYFKA